MLTDDVTSGEDWLHYFKKLNEGNSLNNNIDNMLKNIECNKVFNELDSKITMKELLDALISLKNNKSSGFDRITNEMLKYGKDHLCTPLLKLFNKILYSGFFPKIWSKGFITPLFKTGLVTDPNNYRELRLEVVLGSYLQKL